MSKIEWQLDDGWEDDLVDLLGRVDLTGVYGERLTEPCTNVDVFLASLAAVVAELNATDSPQAEIDLVIEPDPITGTRLSDGRLQLRYGDQTVFFETSTQFEVKLRESISSFLECLPRTFVSSSPSFAILRQYAAA